MKIFKIKEIKKPKKTEKKKELSQIKQIQNIILLPFNRVITVSVLTARTISVSARTGSVRTGTGVGTGKLAATATTTAVKNKKMYVQHVQIELVRAFVDVEFKSELCVGCSIMKIMIMIIIVGMITRGHRIISTIQHKIIIVGLKGIFKLSRILFLRD